jgi:hypothetical protein
MMQIEEESRDFGIGRDIIDPAIEFRNICGNNATHEMNNN